MANKTLTGSIALTKFKNAVVLKKKSSKTGEEIPGIFIPIGFNHLTEKDGAVYADIRIIIRDEPDQYGQNGFISKSLPAEVYKANKDQSDFLKDNQPILGNLKDWSSQGSAESAPVVGEDDDLPF